MVLIGSLPDFKASIFNALLRVNMGIPSVPQQLSFFLDSEMGEPIVSQKVASQTLFMGRMSTDRIRLFRHAIREYVWAISLASTWRSLLSLCVRPWDQREVGEWPVKSTVLLCPHCYMNVSETGSAENLGNDAHQGIDKYLGSHLWKLKNGHSDLGFQMNFRCLSLWGC